MSSPIKPPRGAPTGPASPGAPEPPRKDDPGRTGGVEGSFRGVLESAGGVGADSAAAPEGADDPILRDLRAGRIEPAEALDRMVQRALEAPAAAHLSPARKAELEAHLRQSLRDDPSLAALARDLSRGE